MSCNCNKTPCACQPKKKCGNPCGCAEPVFSIDSRFDDPTQLRFNVNGKSIWYDFDPVIKAGETCTTLHANAIDRTLDYHGECADNTISAKELGAILHLADLGDVDENSITDNGILNYRKEANCGEGCEGLGDGWVSTNPVDAATSSLVYILGSDADGKMFSLMPPANTNQYYTLGWNAQGKASWKQPKEVATAPVDGDGYKYKLYLDPTTREIVVVKEK